MAFLCAGQLVGLPGSYSAQAEKKAQPVYFQQKAVNDQGVLEKGRQTSSMPHAGCSEENNSYAWNSIIKLRHACMLLLEGDHY